MPASRAHWLPPAAHYPFGRPLRLGWAIAALSGLGLACTLAWILQGLGNSGAGLWKGLAAVTLWLGVSALAWRGWQTLGRGVLQWDGAQWVLEPARAAALALQDAPRVALDLHNAMLLRVQPAHGQPLWLWLEASQAPMQWLGMRRALYARAAHAPGAQGPAHSPFDHPPG